MSKIKELLKDKRWRMTSGVLYKVKDRNGKVGPFLPNEHQLKFYEAKMKYNLIIIPKARQLGFSTAEQYRDLDDMLFNRNFSCGIIADSQDVALNIFRDKIKFAWDNLPDVITYKNESLEFKKYFKINTDRANQLSIENTGSIISVGTSYRGGTLQRLHVSEFGKICNRYPQKAQEIMSGALQTVALGQKIVIESTAMGPEGYFFELCQKAKSLQQLGKEPNPMEWKLLFFPWYDEETYQLEGNILIPSDFQDYFEDLEHNHNIYLTIPQKNWYSMKRAQLGDLMFSEYPSYLDEAFMMNLKGVYYERELSSCKQQRRVCALPYDVHLQVHTARDIGGAGGGDDTAIWFFQLYGNEIRIIDFWEGNGRSMIEIFETVIKAKAYQYGTFFGPHDLMVADLMHGETRYDTAKKYGFRFDIVPKIGISEGINIVRQLFSTMRFDEAKCSKGLELLSRYRRKWDDANGVFIDKPMHNGTSHCADALRYLAVGVSQIRNREDPAVVMPLNRDL